MRPKIKTPDTPFVPSDALIASWGGRRIIFIGYMGAGKTTIGRQLALSLGQTFYDLDWYIESRMRRTAKQLFDERGEEGFRKVEHNMLHEVAEFEDVVISCGGGAPCFYDNMDYLNRQGSHCLSQGRARRALRPSEDGTRRAPAAAQQDDGRGAGVYPPPTGGARAFYNKAKYIFDVSLLDNYEKIESTVADLRKMLGIDP